MTDIARSNSKSSQLWCPLKAVERLAQAGLTSCQLQRLPINDQFEHLDKLVRELLFEVPVATLERAGYLMVLRPSGDGFPILISQADGRRLILEFGGWHEDEHSCTTILHLVTLALTGRVRLTDEFVNGRPSRHTVHACDGLSRWSVVGEISFLNFTIFRRRVESRMRRYPGLIDQGEV